jgi:hypothetical protein
LFRPLLAGLPALAEVVVVVMASLEVVGLLEPV